MLRQPLDDEPQAAVGQLEHLVDVRQRADRMQVVLSRLLLRRILLREDADELAAGDRLVDQLDGALAGDRERHEGIRKEHRVAQRQHRHVRRHGVRAVTDAQLDASGFVAHGFVASSMAAGAGWLPAI